LPVIEAKCLTRKCKEEVGTESKITGLMIMNDEQVRAWEEAAVVCLEALSWHEIVQ
jgi:hypothetical protein